jgi:hypothetical protein
VSRELLINCNMSSPRSLSGIILLLREGTAGRGRRGRPQQLPRHSSRAPSPPSALYLRECECALHGVFINVCLCVRARSNKYVNRVWNIIKRSLARSEIFFQFTSKNNSKNLHTHNIPLPQQDSKSTMNHLSLSHPKYTLC